MSSPRKFQRKPLAWGTLGWALPMAYVFWAPYQNHASWPEWLATGLTLLMVMALFLIGITYVETKTIIRRVCIGMFLIAVGFLAYRPSGGLYFALVSSFMPFTVGGDPRRAMAIATALALLFGLEWWLFHAGGGNGILFPAFVTVEIFVVSFAMTFAVRQQQQLHRLNKTNERERIARDLHDVLGHSLSSLALKAELARRLFHSDPQRALLEISEVERIARQGLDEVREAIHGYHSGDIYAELDRVEALLQAADMEVQRHCDPLEIAPAQERVLALVVREAVTNVVRHSRANACRLTLFQTDGTYRLEISDNGCGGDHQEGLGMRSIRTRIEALGGTAVWSSSVGTQLSISLPALGMEQR